MKFIIAASSLSPECVDCDAFVVQIDGEAKAEILARRELFQMVKGRAPDLFEMNFWSPGGQFYSDLCVEGYDVEGGDGEPGEGGGELLTEEESARYEDNGWVAFPDDFEVEDEGEEDGDARRPLRTECDKLIVTERGFFFSVILKYADVYVETREVPFEALLGKEGAP